jgi:uncharacterized protein (DUF1684 family)
MTRRSSLTLTLALFTLGTVAAPSAPAPPPADYRDEIRQYRASREAELKADDGWLTVAGLFWLKPGANVVGSAAGSDIRLPKKAPARVGVFELKDGHVMFTADPDARVTSMGKPVGAGAVAAPTQDPSALTIGDLRMFVIRREDRFGIRMRDLNSAMRREYKGLRFYPVRNVFRVRARFFPYDMPRAIAIPNVLGQAPEMESPGYVTFTLNGKAFRLEPVYETDERKDLFFIFKDTTSHTATYPAGRFLHTDLPKNGVVIIDFNKAYNPPCAFTDFATCPLPPKQNQLPVRIEAGELAYHGPRK